MKLSTLIIFFILFFSHCFGAWAQYGNFGLLKKSIDGRFQIYAQDQETALIAKKQIRNLYGNIIESLGYTAAFKRTYLG